MIGDRAEVVVEGHLRALVGLGGDGELGRDRRSEAFAAWRRYLEALAARNPLVLVFEDLHWADDGLLDFIDHLVEWASGVPLLVVGTARSELLDRRPGWTESREHAVTLSLSPLSDEETVTLVGALLEDAFLTPRAESALLARAAGNPLYAGEYARMLIDRRFGRTRRCGPRRAMTSPCPRRSRESSPPASTPSLLGKGAPAGRRRHRQVVLGRRADESCRTSTLEGRGAAPRARAKGVHPPRAALIGGPRDAVRVLAHPHSRRRVRTNTPRTARGEASPCRRLGRVPNVERTEDRADMLAHHYLSALEFTRASGKTQVSSRPGRGPRSARPATAPPVSMSSASPSASSVAHSTSGRLTTPLGHRCSSATRRPASTPRRQEQRSSRSARGPARCG